jgi:hypothetical protein
MNNRQRITLTRLVTGTILLFLTLRLAEHAMLSALQSPPLFAVELDFTYWLFRASGIPAWIVQHRAVAILFDISLFSSGMLSFLLPLNRKILAVFALLLFIYAMTFNLYATHHLAQVYGLMVVMLPFLVGNNDKFTLAWEGMRYFTCFIYFMAFIWKTCIGNSFYYLQQGASTFKNNLVDYMSLNPGSGMTNFYEWFLRHEWVLNAGEKGLVLLEGIMVAGFFTKKYDRWLIWVPVAIHVTTYFFSDVFFIELLVVDLTFLSVSQLDLLGKMFSGLYRPEKQKKAI